MENVYVDLPGPPLAYSASSSVTKKNRFIASTSGRVEPLGRDEVDSKVRHGVGGPPKPPRDPARMSGKLPRLL
jgi:hypothetical protein